MKINKLNISVLLCSLILIHCIDNNNISSKSSISQGQSLTKKSLHYFQNEEVKNLKILRLYPQDKKVVIRSKGEKPVVANINDSLGIEKAEILKINKEVMVTKEYTEYDKIRYPIETVFKIENGKTKVIKTMPWSLVAKKAAKSQQVVPK